MGGLGAPELIVILVILLLLFGGAKLPKLARSLGDSIKEFRKATEESDGETEQSSDTEADSDEPATRDS